MTAARPDATNGLAIGPASDGVTGGPTGGPAGGARGAEKSVTNRATLDTPVPARPVPPADPADIVVTPTGARFLGRHLPCAIGRGGIATDKREGDGATPAGCHRIVGGAWRPDRLRPPPAPIPMLPLRPGLVWSDDPRDPHYNHLATGRDHPFGHERMWRADPLYDLVLFTDWNWPDARAGLGSAIFIHRWRKPGHPTEGCVAFAPQDLDWILSRLGPRSRLIVRPSGI